MGHAAEVLTSNDLIRALVAERVDRLLDRMILVGHSRLALFGSREHASWLFENIQGLRQLPLVACIEGPSAPWRLPAFQNRPVLSIDDPALPEMIDSVLIADDRYEQALHDLAIRYLPPGIILHRLYERLPIGRKAIESGELCLRRPIMAHSLESRRTWAQAV